MKLPFYTILGPIFRRNHKPIKDLCGYTVLQYSPFYVILLGTLGVLLSIFDIVRIVRCGPVLPGYLVRDRLKTGKLISPEAERDCKLICLVLSTEYYLFLLVGVSTRNPIFFLPFLFLYAIIICLESIIFFIRAFVEGPEYKKVDS